MPPHPHHPDQNAYLSVIAWPTALSPDQRTEALIAAAALDLHEARLAAQRPVPTIAAEVDALIADDILRVLHEHGILAVAPTDDELLLDAAKPEPVTRIVRFPKPDPAAPTVFAVDDNDEPAWTFSAADIRLALFARVHDPRRVVTARRSQLRSADGHAEPPTIIKKTQFSTTELLDLHLTHDNRPRLLRLKGMRTHIRALDESDARPSLLTPDDPVTLLEPHLAPPQRIDTSFDQFHPPRRLRMRAATTGSQRALRTPESFTFYSAWRLHLHNALHG